MPPGWSSNLGRWSTMTRPASRCRETEQTFFSHSFHNFFSLSSHVFARPSPLACPPNRGMLPSEGKSYASGVLAMSRS